MIINQQEANRKKVIMSAYACEPGKGSEPEVGWKWAIHMARHHDVTVITRANNRSNIEAGLQTIEEPHPQFVYHEAGNLCLKAKRLGLPVSFYERAWHRSASIRIRQLVADLKPDLLHHVTFAGFRHHCAILGHGVPAIWGPVGGVERMSWPMLAAAPTRDKIEETLRNGIISWSSSPGSATMRRARKADLVLASTPEMLKCFQQAGVNTQLMPAIGMDPATPPSPTRKRSPGLRLIFAGQLVYWKGILQAIQAVAESPPVVELTVAGDGPMRKQLESIVQSHGAGCRIRFVGKVERQKLLDLYHDHDAFLYPSMHDSGAFVVLEALAAGLPVICLDAGGPGLAVTSACGIKIHAGAPGQIHKDLKASINQYLSDSALLERHSAAAHQSALDVYSWENKSSAMSKIYEEVL